MDSSAEQFQTESFSIGSYLDVLSSREPVPGGGGASALSGAMGASLMLMAMNLTIGKKRYAQAEPELTEIREKTLALKEEFIGLADEDARVFSVLAACYGLPKSTEEEKREKEERMEAALLEASEPPIKLLHACRETLAFCCRVASLASPLIISDAGAAAGILLGSAEGGVFSLYANTKLMKDREKAGELESEGDSLLAACRELAAEACSIVGERLSR